MLCPAMTACRQRGPNLIADQIDFTVNWRLTANIQKTSTTITDPLGGSTASRFTASGGSGAIFWKENIASWTASIGPKGAYHLGIWAKRGRANADIINAASLHSNGNTAFSVLLLNPSSQTVWEYFSTVFSVGSQAGAFYGLDIGISGTWGSGETIDLWMPELYQVQ